MTDRSPEDHLSIKAFLLGLLIPGPSFLLAGLLRLRAPVTIDELIRTTLERFPDPPRPVDRGLVRRVAWGNWTWPASFVGAFLFVVPEMLALMLVSQYRWAPALVIPTLVISFALTGVVVSNYLSDVLRTSLRKTIVLKTVETGVGKAKDATQISYERDNGGSGSTTLDSKWKHLKVGDHLDVLMDPSAKYIRRVLTAPPPQE